MTKTKIEVVKELKTEAELSRKEVETLKYLIDRGQTAQNMSQMYADFAAYARNTLTSIAKEYAAKYGLPKDMDYDLTPEGILKVKE